MKIAAMFTPLQARWGTFDRRQQTLLSGAAFLLGLVLIWLLLVAPALRTLALAESQQRNLDLQWQKMQSLRAQAQALQSQPRITQEAARRALEASVKQRLGASAQLSILGDRATVTLRNTPPEALAQWLTQSRVSAHVNPSEARLVRSVANPGGPATWDGTLVLTLPAQ